jgi:hypothetical protein
MRVSAASAEQAADGVLGTVRVEVEEARILASLADQLQALLSDALDPEADRDGAVRRLLPDAYRHDPELADEWRQLSRRGLVDRKIGFARTLSAALHPIVAATEAGSVPLTDAEALDWVRGVGDLRLVIADRMGIVVDGDEGAFAEPGLRDVYDWLAWLQDSLVQLLEDADERSGAGGAAGAAG